MNKKLLVIGSIVVVFFLMIAGVWISANNQEVSLRNQITAQQKVCEAFYDKLWKVIAQKAQVAEQYKDAFKEIYPDLIAGRYGNEKGGTLMKWITESNPTFDVSLYKDLSASIEGERAGFFMEQQMLIDLDREHKTIRQTFPKNIFIGGRTDVPITIITSDQTEKIYKTGKENDVDIFKKDTVKKTK